MLLKVNHLSVITAGSNPKTILREANFTLPRNSVLTITGRNGSGKTTLIKALTSILNDKMYKVQGEVFLEQKLLTELTPDELNGLRRDKIKYIFQDSINSYDPLRRMGYYFRTLPGSLTETEELLEYFYLPPLPRLSRLYPYELSGGMAQRTAIVLALRARPSLLILDEPTSGIDSPAVNLLLHKLKEFAKAENNSILMITQDLPFAYELSNAVGIIENGILKEPVSTSEFRRLHNGTVEEIILENGNRHQ